MHEHHQDSVVTVGAGLAAFTLARELRRHGFTGAITLIDPEGVPYDRPPLSKDYLSGVRDRVEFVGDAEFDALQVKVVPAVVRSLDRDRRAVLLDDGTSLPAAHIVLAHGGAPRHLPVPGADLPGVLTLRTRDDADRLRSRLVPGHRLVILGAGLIGAEVASTARGLGAEVTLIDPTPVPLIPAVGEQLAIELHQLHAAAGVRALTALPTGIVATADGLQVALGDEVVPADTVLVAIGIEVDRRLADSAGLDFEGGVLVDAHGRTSGAGFHAVGDCARLRGPEGVPVARLEHWEHAMRQGATVAAVIAGVSPPEHGVSWFWSDRYGVHVEGLGRFPADALVVGRRTERDHVDFALDRATGALVGAAGINDPQSIRAARRLIDRGIPVTADELADPQVDLLKLMRRSQAA